MGAKTLAIAGLAIVLASRATIFKGTTQTIAVNMPGVPGHLRSDVILRWNNVRGHARNPDGFKRTTLDRPSDKNAIRRVPRLSPRTLRE
jgi:hypothetical protein